MPAEVRHLHKAVWIEKNQPPDSTSKTSSLGHVVDPGYHEDRVLEDDAVLVYLLQNCFVTILRYTRQIQSYIALDGYFSEHI